MVADASPPGSLPPAAGPASSLSVLHVLTTNGRRGAETYALSLSEALRPLVGRVGILALEPGGQPQLPVPALADHRRSARGLHLLRRRCREADVVVGHGSTTLPAGALATAGGPPFVYRVIGEPGVWTTSRSRRLRTSVLLRRADAVAVYHRRAAEQVVALHGVDARRVHVLRKGIDLGRWHPPTTDERVAARHALGIDAGATVVAWVGALAAEKRPELAIEACTASGADHLLIVGDGPQRPAVERSAARQRGRVQLLGRVDDPRAVLAAADALLLTSTTEGVPGAVLEAQACGVPVVTVDVGGVGEVVVDGVTGRIVGSETASSLAVAIDEVLACDDDLGGAAAAHIAATSSMGDVADEWASMVAAVAAS